MKNLKICFIIIQVVSSLLINVFTTSAQVNTTCNKRRCGTMEHQKALEAADPSIITKRKNIEAFTQEWIKHNGTNSKAVVNIPIVFHVLYNTLEQNISDTNIQEQIDVLNRDFGGLNPHSMGAFPVSLKANTGIQFCLAKQKPDSSATNGIERISTLHTSFVQDGDSMKYTNKGGADAWDVTRYFNIWVCNIGGGLLGYAQLPGGPPATYGVVLVYNCVGTTGLSAPYNEGASASHEVGHSFNLLHTWGDDGTACTGSDQVADTPDQAGEHYAINPPANAVLTDACSPTSPGTMYMNFMDYTDDVWMANFTPDQNARMQPLFVPGGELNSLSLSTACNSPFVKPIPYFSASIDSINNGGTITFTDTSKNLPNSWVWTFEAGIPATFTGQFPPAIVYNTVGDFNVTLVVSNPAGDSTLIKNDYIHVYLLNPPTANFTAAPVNIAVDGSVTFTDTSPTTSFNAPTSWLWTFEEGTPSTFIGQNPPPIVYDSIGDFNVTLEVFNNAGNDSIIKNNYIHVFPANSNPPTADFFAEQTSLTVGGTTNFIDLSTDIPWAWQWTFQGGTPATSNIQNPSGIQYNFVGTYKVTLVVSNGNGSDTMIKTAYIHVDSTYTQKPQVGFTANPRLITTGSTVHFTDTSLFMPTSWEWTFTGGNPATSTIQNPTVLYSTSGYYQVKLKVCNPIGCDSLTKVSYIVVNDTQVPEICGAISNIAIHELMSYWKLPNTNTVCYIPGINVDKIKSYAEKYVDYMHSDISYLLVPVKKAVAGSATSKVTFKIWGNAELPNDSNLLRSIDVNLSSLTEYATTSAYKKITFYPPVRVYGTFFIGYDVKFNANDTFIVKIADPRGVNGLSTLYAKQNSGIWKRIDNIYSNLRTSLGFSVNMCLINSIDAEEEDNNLHIYPNPSDDLFYIEFNEDNRENVEFKVFDLLGKMVVAKTALASTHVYQLDMSNFKTGIYFLNIVNGKKITTKKISLIK